METGGAGEGRDEAQEGIGRAQSDGFEEAQKNDEAVAMRDDA